MTLGCSTTITARVERSRDTPRSAWGMFLEFARNERVKVKSSHSSDSAIRYATDSDDPSIGHDTNSHDRDKKHRPARPARPRPVVDQDGNNPRGLGGRRCHNRSGLPRARRSQRQRQRKGLQSGLSSSDTPSKLCMAKRKDRHVIAQRSSDRYPSSTPKRFCSASARHRRPAQRRRSTARLRCDVGVVSQNRRARMGSRQCVKMVLPVRIELTTSALPIPSGPVWWGLLG